MSQPEYRIVQKIKKYISSRGGWVVKIHGGPYQDPGTPDMIVCYRGKFLAIEVKTPRGVASPEQLATQDSIIAADGRAIITSSVDDVAAVMDSIAQSESV